MRFTAFGPKYSFTRSVITNSSGHNKTPQVRLKDKPLCPNSVILDDVKPNNFSSENILVPIHSAINALATKKAVKPINSFAGLLLSIWCIFQNKEKINLQQEANNIYIQQPKRDELIFYTGRQCQRQYKIDKVYTGGQPSQNNSKFNQRLRNIFWRSCIAHNHTKDKKDIAYKRQPE